MPSLALERTCSKTRLLLHIKAKRCVNVCIDPLQSFTWRMTWEVDQGSDECLSISDRVLASVSGYRKEGPSLVDT